MQRHHVDSTTFRSLGYDDVTATLEAEFADGDVYRYFGVPVRIWRQFEAAPSKGRFFAASVRNDYPYCRVAPENGS